MIDFKATSKASEINLVADWQDGYKRQMEVYQWLLRTNGFKVSNIDYFIYCNGKKDRETFGNRLEFDVLLLPFLGNDKWIEPRLHEIYACLNSDQAPLSSLECDLCKYRKAARKKDSRERSRN